MRAFIFPGQGSQAVGMGAALAAASTAAREVLEEVDDALGEKLSRLMAEGPADELTLTENAQPAIMANAIATLRVLTREGGVRLAEKADYVAGHSLGEYSALCAAQTIDLPTAARLLRTRGQAMQEAVPVGVGTMAALLGADVALAGVIAGAAVDALLAEGGAALTCTVANDNDPSQVVISGHRAAVERAVALAKELGAKRAVLLPVSAPFHCALMQPAAEVMENALLDADLGAPLLPLYCNVDAAPIATVAEIRVALVRQVTGMVRWRESVLAMVAAGVTEFVEFGGKVLTPMVKRIAPDATATSVTTMDEIEALAAAL
ncbi:ACP S-malonyltransferase [uncultured Sphingomonas sp.]|uniref:ACP S-malonyltransferase n=1 Tax=uncultured Sphingomonas sp. TaxID=158754 RepID=UPI0035C9FD07